MGRGNRAVTDFTGKRYKSISHMARFWGTDEKLVTDRLNRGWSTRDALLIASGHKRPRDTSTFTIDELSKLYGVDLDILKQLMLEVKESGKAKEFEEIVRLARLVDLKYGLSNESKEIDKINHTSSDKKSTNEVTDHLRFTYSSFNKMCKAWGMNASTVRYRLKLGWTLKDALEM